MELINNKKIYIDYSNLMDYLKNKSPYIFVERAEVIPGVSATGLKNFTYNEWFFKCHFEDEPIVPGVFQLECIMQTAALAIHSLPEMKDRKIVVKKFIDVDVLNGVFPGDQLNMFAKIKSFRRGIITATGEAYLMKNNEKIITCTADFIMLVPSIIDEFSPKKDK